MSEYTLNKIPTMILLTAAFGVLMHDTQISNATITAVSPSKVVSNNHIDVMIIMRGNKHINIEINSFSDSTHNIKAQQTSTQPKNEDEKKYIAQRRLMGNSVGNEYSWPTI